MTLPGQALGEIHSFMIDGSASTITFLRVFFFAVELDILCLYSSDTSCLEHCIRGYLVRSNCPPGIRPVPDRIQGLSCFLRVADDAERIAFPLQECLNGAIRFDTDRHDDRIKFPDLADFPVLFENKASRFDLQAF